MIHPTAIISDSATVGANTSIGPYCIIGDNVTIGDNCTLKAHVVIDGYTEIGDDNIFFPFAAIGQLTQDLKYDGEPTYLKIGNGNTFRENCTIHRSTSPDTPTTIGDNNLFLCYTHVAHDCIVGSKCIFSNNAALAGHVEIEDHVIVSGLAGIHQFCKIGAHSIVGGFTKVVQDVPPFTIADGNPAAIRGINQIGLQRRGFEAEEINFLRRAYKRIFLKKDTNLSEAMEGLKAADCATSPHVQQLITFIEASERGITR